VGGFDCEARARDVLSLYPESKTRLSLTPRDRENNFTPTAKETDFSPVSERQNQFFQNGTTSFFGGFFMSF
jgi:hypothetical protein